MKKFGEVSIIRPSDYTISVMKRRSKAYLERKFKSGDYVGKDGAAVLNELFAFYDNALRSAIPALASRDVAELLLFQYDECQKIFHGEGIIDLVERREWKEIEGTLRRAIKYMVELVCCEAPGETAPVPKDLAVGVFEIALFSAESAANLAEMSERTHSTFPDQFFVQLDFSLSSDFVAVGIKGRNEGFDERFDDRIRKDRGSREDYLEQPQYDIRAEDHCEFLDDAFLKDFGATYGEFLYILKETIDGARPSPKGFPTLFIHRENLISQLLEISKLSKYAIESAIDGFTVNPEVLKKEGRHLWNPKQPSRALRRGFFLFPHPTGVHLAFSHAMAMENLIHLVNSVPYQKIPSEWATPATNKAAKSLSNEAGDWFEKQVCSNLEGLGYEGSGAKNRVWYRGQSLPIPREVGQLDYLGFDSNQNLILFIECKMSLTGLEARFWRDDLDRFVGRDKSHRAQTLRKAKWVYENRQEIGDCFGISRPCKVAVALVTLYPCIADEVIEEFRCISLAELMIDHKKFGEWPYSVFETPA
ncbi:hypothetical protein VSU19_22290 [Verrucomicrobiales bacterium BCK34]|nr:hypothetical protein [Verrucomicrobiales bacterium BCK34]